MIEPPELVDEPLECRFLDRASGVIGVIVKDRTDEGRGEKSPRSLTGVLVPREQVGILPLR